MCEERSERTSGGTDALVLQKMDQSAESVFIFTEGGRMFEARAGFFAVNADLAFFGEGDEFVSTPGAERRGKRRDGAEAVFADRKDRDVAEGRFAKTAIGGENGGKEALSDKAEDSRGLSLLEASTAGAG